MAAGGIPAPLGPASAHQQRKGSRGSTGRVWVGARLNLGGLGVRAGERMGTHSPCRLVSRPNHVGIVELKSELSDRSLCT